MDIDKQKIKKFQEELKNGIGIPLYDTDTIRYLEKPIGKAIYKNAIGRPKKRDEDKANYYDRIVCDSCGIEYTRAHRSAHRKTKVHQAYEKMNNKMKKFLVNEDD